MGKVCPHCMLKYIRKGLLNGWIMTFDRGLTDCCALFAFRGCILTFGRRQFGFIVVGVYGFRHACSLSLDWRTTGRSFAPGRVWFGLFYIAI